MRDEEYYRAQVFAIKKELLYLGEVPKVVSTGNRVLIEWSPGVYSIYNMDYYTPRQIAGIARNQYEDHITGLC